MSFPKTSKIIPPKKPGEVEGVSLEAFSIEMFGGFQVPYLKRCLGPLGILLVSFGC